MATTTSKLGLPRPEASDNVTLGNEQALIDAIDSAAASQADLDAHTGDDTAHVTAVERAAWNTHLGATDNPHDVTVGQIGAWKGFTQLTSADNLDSIVEDGMYGWIGASKPISAPADYGFMIVGNDGSQPTQTVLGGVNGQHIQRRRNNGIWSNWLHFETTSGAKLKADAAEQAAYDAAVAQLAMHGFGEQTKTYSGDANDMPHGEYMASGITNEPLSNNWTFYKVYNNNTGSYKYQEAYIWNGAIRKFVRRKFAGTWQPWQEIYHTGNLPNPAQTNVNNMFTAGQIMPQIILSDSSSNMSVRRGNNNTYLDIDFPEVSTSRSYVRMFRLTNNTGDTALEIHRGDGTNNPTFIFDPKNEKFVFSGVEQPKLRSTNGYLEWNDNGTWRAVGGVKRVQRGVAALANSPTVDITISAVNTNNSFVTMEYAIGYDNQIVSLELVDSTTIRFSKGSGLGGSIPWQVVEYY